MDAEHWCLTCETYMDNGDSPYCSDHCRAMSQQPSPPVQVYYHPSPAYTTTHYPSFAHRRSSHHHRTPSSSVYDSAYSEDLSVSQQHLPARAYESASAWIGKGPKGIYEWARHVHPGPPPHAALDITHIDGAPAELDPLRPSLLTSCKAQRRPVPPKMFAPSNAGKTQPAPPVPSRPILAAQTSMPSLTTHSATASLSSIATPAYLAHASLPSSARVSVHAPSKPASVADDDDESPPSAETRRPTLLAHLAGRITAHMKTWAAGEHSTLVNHPPYSTAHHLNHPSHAAAPRLQPSQRSPTAATVRPSKARLSSPVALFPADPDLFAQLESDIMSSAPLGAQLLPPGYREDDDQPLSEKRQHARDDHPAFLARGRRTERAIS